MALVSLKNISLSIPIIDARSKRLFNPDVLGRKRKVGADSKRENGALKIDVIKNVSIEIRSSDRLGLIGHNGAGKTTLLKIMANILPIDSGLREIVGNSYIFGGANLINPECSGFENIDLELKIRGVKRERRQEIKAEIMDFTELGEYLSLPTRVYSAGMLSRLVFALATVEAPDILLIDEGIGAGDQNFINKVEQRILEFTSRVSIIVCASHSADLLRKLCKTGAVMKNGEIVFLGDLEEALNFYDKDNQLS